MLDGSDGLFYLLLVLLIAASAFFSATETGLSTANKIRMKNNAEAGDRRAKLVVRLSESYDKAISTILVGNNVVNIASTSVATMLFTRAFGAEMGAALSTAVMTVVILTFGEILPKNFAKANSDRVILTTAGALSVLIKLLSPLVFIFVKLSALVTRKRKGEEQPSVTEEELKYIIESIEDEGVLEEQESELVQSALDFDEITVQEILTPRVDMVTVNVDADEEEVLSLVRENGISRIPVYEKTVDHITGLVRARDVLLCSVEGRPIRLRELQTPCKFVHKNMKISQLLNQFRHDKSHLAIVTDDYGGTMGLVTLEDILEELVGDIWDEYDDVVTEFQQVSDNVFEVSGDYNIYDLLEDLEVDSRDFESDYNTLGGWTTEILEHIPEEGESFTYKNLKVTVLKMEEQRVAKLRIERTPAEKPEDED